jgi:hypothetical protein
MLTTLPLLPLILSLLTHTLYTYLTNPLRRIPAAHPLAHFTSLWIHWIRWRGIENATLKAAHAKHGPIICLGPDEISVNCVRGGIRDVYAGGFEKVGAKGKGMGKGIGTGGFNWYGFFANYGG